MSRSLHREQVGLPTSRQRALVLLVLVNANGKALHPIAELHARLGHKVPLQTVWNILSRLLHEQLLDVRGTNDRRAGYVLKPDRVRHAVREIEAEMARPLGDHEASLGYDAQKLGLALPPADLFQPSPKRIPNGQCRNGYDRNEER